MTHPDKVIRDKNISEYESKYCKKLREAYATHHSRRYLRWPEEVISQQTRFSGGNIDKNNAIISFPDYQGWLGGAGSGHHFVPFQNFPAPKETLFPNGESAKAPYFPGKETWYRYFIESWIWDILVGRCKIPTTNWQEHIDKRPRWIANAPQSLRDWQWKCSFANSKSKLILLKRKHREQLELLLNTLARVRISVQRLQNFRLALLKHYPCAGVALMPILGFTVEFFKFECRDRSCRQQEKFLGNGNILFRNKRVTISLRLQGTRRRDGRQDCIPAPLDAWWGEGWWAFSNMDALNERGVADAIKVY